MIVHHPSVSPAQTLRDRILRFIDAPSGDDFDALALDAHAYQYRANAPYRRFVDRAGKPPPRSWRDLPAVQTLAFKETVLACADAERVYESSGTTRGPAHRARHHVPFLALYRAAALAGFARAVLPRGHRRPFVVAAPERVSHPASSLGEMVSWLREVHDRAATPSFLRPEGLDVAGLADAFDACEAGEPVLVLAVTSALLTLADHAARAGRRWRLPAESLIVDTGGSKGYARDVPRAEILTRYEAVLGVGAGQVVNEYGMTEMCSQLYAHGDGVLETPPWVRALVWDPGRGREQQPGEPGLLRYVDLANLGSVVAIQTEDVGHAVAGGIELLGRAQGAEARGCSLLLERGQP